ncbi:MAG: hypothetical protein DMF37_03060 [Verrucomicrobia bacterium]|nr:MAG: hypothetical protein DMF37_03060 [Verrucomicrobiota bacterium]
MIGSTLSKRSSDDFSDFLLSFIFAGSAFDGVPCAKRDEIDESMTAIVRVIFPGFISYQLDVQGKERQDALFKWFVHGDADARRSRRNSEAP